MTSSFTKRLILSLGLFLLMGLVMLAAVIAAQRDRLDDLALSQSDEFVPLRLVHVRETVTRELITILATRQPPAPDQVGAPSQGCPVRGVRILKDRLQLSDGQFDLLLQRSQTQLGGELGCRRFLETLDWVSRQSSLLTISDPSLRHRAIASASTERVSWVSLPPCLMAKGNSGEWITLAGARGRCPTGGSVYEVSKETRDIGQWIYRRAVVSESVDGRATVPKLLEISIDPAAQRVLESLSRCMSSQSTASRDCGVREVALGRQVGSFAITVINQSTGAVAAMVCSGTLCGQSGLQGSESLAPLLAQSPPASTAKLFVALALAAGNSGVMPETLALQIKTSGQVDDAQSKRNEWWERSMVCDLESHRRRRPLVKSSGPSAPLEAHLCGMPTSTESVAGRLGFNEGCESPGAVSCGRINLGTQGAVIPGFLGRFQPQGTETDTRYLDWSSYESIRSGAVPPPRAPFDLVYLRSSRAVQSVIGAGDARISSLGLAHLAGQVVGLGRGEATNQPWLVRERSKGPPTLPAARSIGATGASGLGRSAVQVIDGMARVMRPAEPRWQGQGTAYPAVSAQWGTDACRLGCPLWGKTGTVGKADKVFGGTTTFAAAFHWRSLAQQLSSTGLTPVPASTEGLWSVGIIAIPSRPLSTAAGHSASQLGLITIDRLIRQSKDAGP